MQPTNLEAAIRLSAFIGCLAFLALAEHLAPRRRRAIGIWPRWLGNLGLIAAATILLRSVPLISAVSVATLANAQGWGALGVIALPAWLEVLLSVVVLDLAIYLQHRLFHAVSVLWRLHRVHHTDPELDVTTGVRFHPVEMLLSVGFRAVAILVVGPPVIAVIVFEVLLNAGSLFSHANLALPVAVDRWLRTVLVTPDMHRLHHSADPTETNTNFGFTLSWWDHLFATYRAQPALGHDAMAVGVHGFAGPAVVNLYPLLIQPLLREPPLPQSAATRAASGPGIGRAGRPAIYDQHSGR